MAVVFGALAPQPAAAQDDRLGTSGLTLPRFVSLKSGEVNLRTGPGKRYPIDWIYRRRGLPVEVIDEFEDWRRVRDHDGTVGWVHRFMLVSRRTVLVMGATRTLRRKPEPDATGLAYLEAGVIARPQGLPQGLVPDRGPGIRRLAAPQRDFRHQRRRLSNDATRPAGSAKPPPSHG